MKEKIVCVEWGDACYHSGYSSTAKPEDLEPMPTRTVGHLVKRTKEAVIVAQDRFYLANGKVDAGADSDNSYNRMVKAGEIDPTVNIIIYLVF